MPINTQGDILEKFTDGKSAQEAIAKMLEGLPAEAKEREPLEIIYTAVSHAEEKKFHIFVAIETPDGDIYGGGGMTPIGTLKLFNQVRANLKTYTETALKKMSLL